MLSCEFPRDLLQKFYILLKYLLNYFLQNNFNALLMQKADQCFLTYTAFGEITFIAFIKQISA